MLIQPQRRQILVNNCIHLLHSPITRLVRYGLEAAGGVSVGRLMRTGSGEHGLELVVHARARLLVAMYKVMYAVVEIRYYLRCQARKTARGSVWWPTAAIPLPKGANELVFVDLLPKGPAHTLVFKDRFSRCADLLVVTATECIAEGPADILANQYYMYVITRWDCPKSPSSCSSLYFLVCFVCFPLLSRPEFQGIPPLFPKFRDFEATFALFTC